MRRRFVAIDLPLAMENPAKIFAWKFAGFYASRGSNRISGQKAETGNCEMSNGNTLKYFEGFQC
jgi:hypothetical protein